MRKRFIPVHSCGTLRFMYEQEQKSTHQIASELNWTPSYIRKELLYFGIKLRTRAEAQTNALKTGAAKHPTANTVRSEEVKEKIKNTLKEKNYGQGPTKEE